jgi:hypothetical protein
MWTIDRVVRVHTHTHTHARARERSLLVMMQQAAITHPSTHPLHPYTTPPIPHQAKFHARTRPPPAPNDTVWAPPMLTPRFTAEGRGMRGMGGEDVDACRRVSGGTGGSAVADAGGGGDAPMLLPPSSSSPPPPLCHQSGMREEGGHRV